MLDEVARGEIAAPELVDHRAVDAHLVDRPLDEHNGIPARKGDVRRREVAGGPEDEPVEQVLSAKDSSNAATSAERGPHEREHGLLLPRSRRSRRRSPKISRLRCQSSRQSPARPAPAATVSETTTKVPTPTADRVLVGQLRKRPANGNLADVVGVQSSVRMESCRGRKVQVAIAPEICFTRACSGRGL